MFNLHHKTLKKSPLHNNIIYFFSPFSFFCFFKCLFPSSQFAPFLFFFTSVYKLTQQILREQKQVNLQSSFCKSSFTFSPSVCSLFSITKRKREKEKKEKPSFLSSETCISAEINQNDPKHTGIGRNSIQGGTEWVLIPVYILRFSGHFNRNGETDG